MSSFVINQLEQDYFFKVPEISHKLIIPKNIHNILLCDSSGSMKPYWAKVAQGWNNMSDKLEGSVSIILFTDNVFRHEGRILPNFMLKSGGTDIIKGLMELEKEIKKYLKYDLIRVYFITDGADGNQSTFQKRFDNTMNKYYKPTNNVEFYVLGLTGNFPAYVSQAIRANIHTGRSIIPNLFWSQSCSEQEITTEFENIFKLNKTVSKIQLPLGGQSTPFSDPINTFYTGDWVLIPKQKEIPNWFECEGNVYQLETNLNPTFDNLLEMFAQWVGQLQIKSIKLTTDTNAIKLCSSKTKDKMEQMYQNFIRSMPILNKMKTFTERVANKKIKTRTYQYQSYLKIANDLASGLKLQFMDNIELAKQLKGVYVGKYSEKAFKLRSHTDEDFEKDKEAFIKILKETLPLLKDIESTDHCVITLDNTLDIIRSEGFIETLTNTTSKIEFLQNIGITGNGVLLNITDAATINPWVTQVKDIAIHCAILSTTAIEDLIDNPPANTQLTQYEKDNCVVAIQTGGGDVEKINCVIPLFRKKVAEVMGPIIRSNLFQLICTYSIQKSPFTLNHNAHLGALSGLLGYLLSQPKSEWRETTIKKIRSTSSVYLSRKGLQDFVEKLWSNPARAVVTEIPDEGIKCESITKLLLMILVSANDKSPEQIAETICHVCKEYIGRIIGTKTQISDWFDLADPTELSDNVEFPTLESIYAHGYTVAETKKAIEREIRSTKFTFPNSLEIKLDTNKLKTEWNGGSVGNISWKGLKVFTNSIGYDITEENIFQYVVHGLKHLGSAERMCPIDSYSESKEWVINELIGLKFAKLREQTIIDYKSKASEKYFESFGNEHQIVLPMKQKAIIEEANKLGIEVNDETFDSIYTFNPNNKLLANACMGKDCPYYLHPRTDFSAHIERMKLNPDFIHSYHRTIFTCKTKSVNKIIENISDGYCRPGKYSNEPIKISKKIIIEKYSGDVEMNRDIYMGIYG